MAGLVSTAVDDLTRLALRARDGDRVALGALIRRTQADVWRVCRHLGPRDAADDLTQDVYLRMVRSLPRFAGQSTVRTWLLAIARNTAIDALRAAKRRERLGWLLVRDVEPQAPDHRVELDTLLEELDADQRTAFVLTQVMGLSYAEVAEVCGCPVGTVRSRVARARSRLIAALGDDAQLYGSAAAETC